MGPLSMLFTGIDHPAIACYDTKRLAEWYCKMLGMKVVATNDADPPAFMVGYEDSTRIGTMIELMPVRNPGPKPAEFQRWQPGVRHIALRVSDFDRAYATLTDAGVEFVGEPGNAVGGGRIVSFRDPEGNELQIVQR